MSDLAATAVLVAVTLVIWPDRRRLAAFARATPAHDGGAAVRDRRDTRWALPRSTRGRWRGRDRAGRPTPAAAGARLAGVVAAAVAVAGVASRTLPWQLVVAALLAGYTASSLVRHARVAARRRRDLAGLTAALRSVVRELHAGALPRAAIDHAASAASPTIRMLLESLAPRGSAEREWASQHPATALPPEVAGRLRSAWAMSVARGVPLAAVMSACIADLDDRAALQRLRAQQVAGPAVSGYVLAALPVAGIAMGAGMGSHPVAVLLGSTLGGVLLVLGVGLCCAGLLWAGRIVRGARHD